MGSRLGRPVLGCLCCQGVALLCGCFPPVALFHLSCVYHVHKCDTVSEDAGPLETLEAEHRSGAAFDGVLVLPDDVGQILDLRHEDPFRSLGVDNF